MNEKHNDATHNRPEGERLLNAQSLVIDLPTYVRQIREEEAWQKNDRNSITVFKNEHMTVVLGALHANAELKTHKAEGTMTIQVLEGGLEVSTDELNARLWTGNIIAINKYGTYSVLAIEESLYLLTITAVK